MHHCGQVHLYIRAFKEIQGFRILEFSIRDDNATSKTSGTGDNEPLNGAMEKLCEEHEGGQP
jgi:hypothetical protein